MALFILRPSSLCAPALMVLTTLLALAAPLDAQGTGSGSGMRVGLTVGGISTVGVALEFYRDQESIDVNVGTWSFHDLSVSAVFKEYFGAGDVRPFIGGGLWFVFAHPSGERPGFAAVLRAPVGVDWHATGNHFLGAALNVNRALMVRRTDPDDETPLNTRLVPLPGLYYRFRR